MANPIRGGFEPPQEANRLSGDAGDDIDHEDGNMSLQRVEIEPADNGFMSHTSYKGKGKDPKYETKHAIHPTHEHAAAHVGKILAKHKKH